MEIRLEREYPIGLWRPQVPKEFESSGGSGESLKVLGKKLPG